jgi:two-component system, OmpR family, alkaline phosphatase synthesis response regulator PhoP
MDVNQQQPDAPPADPNSPGAPRTILVADDETHILNVVSLKLRNAGFRVLCARDGQEAWETCQQERPDLLITDHNMPHMSGLELCQRLRADPRLSKVPAIMLSARGFQLEEIDTAASGIVMLISKPFSPRQLLTAVDDVLGSAAGLAAGTTTKRQQGSDAMAA